MKKLKLNRQTIRRLDSDQLSAAVGGRRTVTDPWPPPPTEGCSVGASCTCPVTSGCTTTLITFGAP